MEATKTTEKSLTVSISPHVKQNESVPKIMWTVIACLMPALILATVLFGWQVLALTATSILSCVAVEAICQGAKLGAGGIAKLSKDIQKGNLVAIKSLKGELVAAGTSLFSSQEIMNADSGLVVDTNKVFMDTGIYPKGW